MAWFISAAWPASSSNYLILLPATASAGVLIAYFLMVYRFLLCAVLGSAVLRYVVSASFHEEPRYECTPFLPAHGRKCVPVSTSCLTAHTDLPTLVRPMSAFQALHKVFHFHYLCHRNHDILTASADCRETQSRAYNTSYMATTASTLILP